MADLNAQALNNHAENYLAQRLASLQEEPSAKPAPQQEAAPAPDQDLNAAAHSEALRQAAESAKQKYMQENNVDENGQPVSKIQLASLPPK